MIQEIVIVPAEPEAYRVKCEELKQRIRPGMLPDEAIKMQLEVLSFASELTYPVYLARLEESQAAAEAKRNYTTAFLLAQGSDRTRDSIAKADAKTRIAEVKAAEAEVYRRYLEDLRQDFVALHHSCKAILKDVTQERIWSG